jgi:hypothetical protein
VVAFREVERQFQKIGFKQFAVAFGAVFRTLLEIVFQEIDERVERFAQYLIALARKPAHLHAVAQVAPELIAQAGFAHTGFAKQVGHAGKLTLAQRLGEAY